MVMFRLVSKIVDGKRVKERIKFTAQEEADTLVQWAANEAEQATEEIERKRKKLIAHEHDKLISTQRTAIEKMDDAALDAAITDAGL